MYNKFLMGVKFWTSWGVAPPIFKTTPLRWLFSKIVSNLWFLKNLPRIFHIKLKAIFFNGISFENWRRFQKKFKGISFVKMKKFFIHTRASLARAVLSRVLSRPRYRPLLSVLVEVKWKWSESESEKWMSFWSFNFFQFKIY